MDAQRSSSCHRGSGRGLGREVAGKKKKGLKTRGCRQGQRRGQAWGARRPCFQTQEPMGAGDHRRPAPAEQRAGSGVVQGGTPTPLGRPWPPASRHAVAWRGVADRAVTLPATPGGVRLPRFSSPPPRARAQRPNPNTAPSPRTRDNTAALPCAAHGLGLRVCEAPQRPKHCQAVLLRRVGQK